MNQEINWFGSCLSAIVALGIFGYGIYYTFHWQYGWIIPIVWLLLGFLFSWLSKRSNEEAK